jgi:hypothetical protein
MPAWAVAPRPYPEMRASDAYSHWLKLVEAARETICVFSPYFDHTLVRLLSRAPISADSIHVVTDLRPSVGTLDSRAQLRAIENLIKAGYHVRTLSPLHAKVLWVDENRITAGSQNFTSFGRKSREVTATPADFVNNSRLLRKLRAWLELSMEVDLETVRQLLSAIEDSALRLKRARLDIDSKVLETLAGMELRRTDEQHPQSIGMNGDKGDPAFGAAFRRIWTAGEPAEGQASESLKRVREGLQRVSRASSVRSPVYARLKRVGGGSDYLSLMVHGSADLARPALFGIADAGKPLKMYPVLLTDSGRMGFARVTKSRITYVRFGVDWNARLEIDQLSTSVKVTFPKSNTLESNIVVTFTEEEGASLNPVRVRLRFDGCVLEVIDAEEVFNGLREPTDEELEWQQAFNGACVDLFREPEQRAHFVGTFFHRFSYRELGRDRKNANDFFEDGWYRMGWIEYERTPMLVATRVS